MKTKNKKGFAGRLLDKLKGLSCSSKKRPQVNRDKIIVDTSLDRPFKENNVKRPKVQKKRIPKISREERESEEIFIRPMNNPRNQMIIL